MPTTVPMSSQPAAVIPRRLTGTLEVVVLMRPPSRGELDVGMGHDEAGALERCVDGCELGQRYARVSADFAQEVRRNLDGGAGLLE